MLWYLPGTKHLLLSDIYTHLILKMKEMRNQSD